MIAEPQIHSRPHKRGDQTAHYWLAKRMAKSTGVDVCTAFDAGRIDNADWSEIIRTCQDCTWVNGCKRFLQHADATGNSNAPASIPSTCPNSETLTALKADEPVGK